MTEKGPIDGSYIQRVAFRLGHDPIVFCAFCGYPGWGSDMLKKYSQAMVTRWHPQCHVQTIKKIM